MKYQFLFVILLLWGCSAGQKKEDTSSTAVVKVVLNPESFKNQLSSDGNAVVLDVRTPGEVAEGIIPGALVLDFNAPDFAEKLSGLDKGKNYYVYCKVGGRSSKAADMMEAAGFSKIYNLEGGYDAWVERGFETAVPE